MRLIKIIFISLFLLLYPYFDYPCVSGAQDLREEAKAHYLKGKEYYNQAKYKEAREEFQKGLALISEEENKNEENKNKKGPAKTSEYTIGEEDILYISVWQDKDLSQEAAILPDGRISFPLAGEIPVVGLTIPQVKAEISRRLKAYIKDPIVSVSLRKIGGRRVIVLGQVLDSGVYPITGSTTALEAVAMAGGFNPDGVLSSVILIRGGFKNPKASRLSLTRALSQADPKQNVALAPGDIIYVPKKFIANVNYFMDQFLGSLSQGIDFSDKVRQAKTWTW